MMNILFDFLTFQHAEGIGGHASFTKRILDELLLQNIPDIKLCATTDSTMQRCKSFDVEEFCTANNITTVDLSKEKLCEVIQKHRIDVFFIAIGQLYSRYNLDNINCKTIMFIHDLFDIERYDNKIDSIIYDKNIDNVWKQLKCYINLYSGRWKKQMTQCYNNIMQLYNSPQTIACTVSDYTKNSIKYYFQNIKKDIKVYYSPLKYTKTIDEIENDRLSAMITSGNPYLLMIAANRRYKNPSILMKVFCHLQQDFPDLHLITLKYGKSIGAQHIDIPYLSDSDLEKAYEHAVALFFGSFFEGFGYPPIEAAKYGTPVVASNVTSIPEILGDAGVYFSPFYPADLYRALKSVLQNRDLRKEAIIKRYEEVCLRQQADLQEIVKQILCPK